MTIRPPRRQPSTGRTFRMAGDLGDLIYSLPMMRAVGGGEVLIEAAPYTRQMLTPDKWCGIDKLLRAQPYITGVREWIYGENATVNANDFRARLGKSLRVGQGKEKALVDWILETHGVPLNAKDEAWLTVEPNPVAKVVFNRTGIGRVRHLIYHNIRFPWHRVWAKYGKDAVFIGTPEEYKVFRNVSGEVPYHPTADLFEAARVIAGAELFVGNQSVCHAMAEGLKKRILLEVWPEGCNTLHFREGVTHGWNEDVVLPEL